ncbi:MAG TPA: CocE/NonD family hydrolase [Steroidobacteraceae bacterium]|nr:CocE/NonD family hydrolase [Steroidobacteraceae bacterium]
MRRALGIVLSALLLPGLAAAQSLEFHAPASVYDATTPAVMRDLASRIIPVYRSDNREQYLANMSALQLVAGSFEPAYSARLELRRLRGGNPRRPPVDSTLVYDLYAHTKSLQAQYRLPLAQAFDLAFWETIPIFDNLDAYRVESWLQAPLAAYAQALQASFDHWRGHPRIGQRDALALIWQYLAFDAYRSFGPIAPGLISLDEDRRYIIQDDVVIDTPGRGAVVALLVRPRSGSELLTTLLQYRISPGGHDDAIEAAAYGFASMVAFTPRVRTGRHAWQVIPFEGEEARVRAVIGWIAKQPWSDAQVGMYGDGYSGFAAWAAVKRLPPQLKAIATSDVLAPGVNFPMDRRIGLNSAYCWLQRVAQEREASAAEFDTGAGLTPQTGSGAGVNLTTQVAPDVRVDLSARAESGGAGPTGNGATGNGASSGAANGATANSAAPNGAAASGAATAAAPAAAPGTPAWCDALNAKWYASGKPFRDLPRLAHRPSETFRRWLEHPAYDEYWRRLVPSPQELARLDIPILSLSGYYTAGEAGTLFHFLRHYEHDAHADQILVLGPYDRAEMRQGRAQDTIHGLRTDPTAVIDLRALELQWFSYLFLNDPKPALLADRVNFEVMGANAWLHAGTLDDLAKDRVRLYLAAEPNAGSGLLTPREPASRAAIHLTINLARRKDGGEPPPQGLMTTSVPVENGFAFVSGPLPGGLQIAGRFSGHLRLQTNKRDLDLTVALYELLPDGSYFHLFAPAEEFRASYLRDPARRRLLAAGTAQSLDFTSARITAVRVESGARLVMVLRVSKRPDREINYGSGRAVSGESIAAAHTPVKLSLLRGSYLNLPITEEPSATSRPAPGH